MSDGLGLDAWWDVTTHEWALILSHLGASPEEVSDVQKRMGRVWR
jgi:hypothetical protein